MGRIVPCGSFGTGRCASAIACAGVLLLGVALNQTATHWRADRADSDLFVYFGWCIDSGARPYLDFWDNKPPGIWWANAAAIQLCGSGVEAELLLGSAALLTALAAFVGTARLAYRRTLLVPAALIGVVLLADVRFDAGGDRTETFVVACEMVAVFAYLRWLRRRRLRWLALCGLAAGTAPLFKQAGVAAVAACAAHMVWTQWHTRSVGCRPGARVRPWPAWLVAGGTYAIPIALAGAVLAQQGALGEALFAVGRFNRAYFAVRDATWVRLDQAVMHYVPGLRLLAGSLVLAGCGLAWGWVSRIRSRAGAVSPRRGSGLFLLWFLLAAYLALVGPGRRSYHLMPLLPPLALLTLYPLHLLAGRRGLQARLVAHPGAAVAVVVYGYVLALSLAGQSETLARCWHAKPAWWALRTTDVLPFELQAAAIDRLARADDTIYVWGWSPGTYRYARRLPASRYATFEKLGQVASYANFIFERGTADLRERPPRVIVISLPDYAGLVDPPASPFGAWLAAHYELVSTVGGMHLLARR